MFSALVLKLLGVSDDDVVQDYMLTEQQEPYSRRLLDEVEAGESLASREPRVAREPPNRNAIESVLQRLVSQYGGAYGYFAHHGVTSEQLGAFVESHLEPPLAELRTATTAPVRQATPSRPSPVSLEGSCWRNCGVPERSDRARTRNTREISPLSSQGEGPGVRSAPPRE